MAVDPAKIGNENTAYRTILRASIAILTLAIVDLCQIIFHADRSRRTILLALHTADTGVGAFSFRHRALFGIGTGNDHLLHVCDQLDQPSRTRLGAQTATNTFSRIHVSDPVLDTDCSLWTDLGAIPKADTPVVTLSRASVDGSCRRAGLDPIVVHFL